MKELIIDIVSFLAWMALRAQCLFMPRRYGFRVLLYHSITDAIGKEEDRTHLNVPPGLFKRQISFLEERGYVFINLSQCYDIMRGKIKCPKQSLLLTFDDGLRNILEEVIPFLKGKGIRPVVFISCNYTESGECFPWISNKGLLNPMSWEDIAAICNYADISSHSMSHMNMRRLSESEIARECLASKQLIEQKTGNNVISFSYPFGFSDAFDNRVKKILDKSGYKIAFSNIFGENKLGNDLFELRRMRVSASDIPFRLLMKMEGANDWIDKAKILYIRLRDRWLNEKDR